MTNKIGEEMGFNAMPKPSEADLNDPMFNAIWEAIKYWDIGCREFYAGYTGAMGNHVMLILNALKKAQQDAPKEFLETFDKHLWEILA